MIVGYARTSTVEQSAGLEAQIKELKAAGCEKLFQEQVSSVGKRAQLAAALEFVREDDVLVVTQLDRLARSVRDLMNTIAHLDRKKVGLRVLNLGMDTHTPTGKLIPFSNRFYLFQFKNYPVRHTRESGYPVFQRLPGFPPSRE